MEDLTQEILQGKARAIARAISLAENDSQSAREIIKKIFPYSGQSTVIGITGAPGSGKSTLVECGAMIKSPAVIGDCCEVRQGAYLLFFRE